MNHLDIMWKKYLNKVYALEKTIESRATINCILPFGIVKDGDFIYFKESGSTFIDLMARVEKKGYYRKSEVVEKLNEYKSEICIDDDYIKTKSDCRYLSLFWLVDIHRIEKFYFHKNDQRSWIANFNVEGVVT